VILKREDLINRLQELDNSLGEIYDPHEEFPPALVKLFNDLRLSAWAFFPQDSLFGTVKPIEVFMGKTLDTVDQFYSRFVGVVRVEIGQMIVVLERDVPDEELQVSLPEPPD
jgi:hypothetical protein